MADESDNTTPPKDLKDQYAERFATDLENNEQEQEGLREQIGALQARLAGLEKDHALLSRWQGTLDSGLEAPPIGRVAPAESSDAAAVPQPRAARKKASATPTTKSARKKAAAKTQGAVKATEATTPAKPSMAAKTEKTTQTGGKKNEPTLRELVLDLLTRHYEPRTAGEVRDDVKKAYGREPSDQVVRNTLNSLIAKGAVEREKKQGNVFFTAVKKKEEKVLAPTSESAPETVVEQAVAAGV